MFVIPLCASVYMCLWSPSRKRLTSCLSFVVICILGKVWYLIVWIADLYTLIYFLNLKGGCTGSNILHFSKCHVVGNHMSRLELCLLPVLVQALVFVLHNVFYKLALIIFFSIFISR